MGRWHDVLSFSPKETGQQYEAVALLENCAFVPTGYAELGVGDDRTQGTGVAAVDCGAHAVDDMGDLPTAAEEDTAHIINGDPGSSGNRHRVVFDDVDSQVKVGVDAETGGLVRADVVRDHIGRIAVGAAIGPGSLARRIIGQLALVED